MLSGSLGYRKCISPFSALVYPRVWLRKKARGSSVGKWLYSIHYFLFSLSALPFPAFQRGTRPRLEMDKEESLAGKA